MIDMAIVQLPDGSFDFEIVNGDIAPERSLRTAVIMSLFTDRLANEDDEIPDGTTNRRGWWGDQFAEVEGDLIGSRLWLLSREKQTDATLQRALEYCEEALQYLIDDGVVDHIDIEAEWVSRGVLGIRAVPYQSQNPVFDEVFTYSLLEAA